MGAVAFGRSPEAGGREGKAVVSGCAGAGGPGQQADVATPEWLRSRAPRGRLLDRGHTD